jgi:head-tail adaptor
LPKDGAGYLNRQFRFEVRSSVSDGAGNTVDDWVQQFTVAAGRTFLRGGEAVISARLESRQPAIVRVRNSTNTRQITPDWRAVDERTGEVYNIREIPRETEDRLYLEFLAESGVAP